MCLYLGYLRPTERQVLLLVDGLEVAEGGAVLLVVVQHWEVAPAEAETAAEAAPRPPLVLLIPEVAAEEPWVHQRDR